MDTATVDLSMNQGEDWAVQMIFTDENDRALNVVHPARMDCKDTTGTVQFSLLSTDTPAASLDDIPGLTLSSSIGLVQLYLSSDRTDTLEDGTFIYDLFANVDDGDVYAGTQVVRLAQGRVVIHKRITESF